MKPETKERAKGTAQKIGGQIEEAVGQVTGNEEQVERGQAKQVVGEARKEGAKAAGRARGTLQQAGGKIKKAVGQALDDEELEAEGHLQDVAGKARRKANE